MRNLIPVSQDLIDDSTCGGYFIPNFWQEMLEQSIAQYDRSLDIMSDTLWNYEGKELKRLRERLEHEFKLLYKQSLFTGDFKR